MSINKITRELKSISNKESVEAMARFGITPKKAFGVSIPELRRIAAAYRKDHGLALKLWDIDTRETRILASMIDDPEAVTEKQMDSWARKFDYWEICDQCCMNLFEKTPYAYKKAAEWCLSDSEFVKRSGFVMMARLAVSDKKADNRRLEAFFSYIKAGSADERNYVKKAVSWALRQIGKKNSHLHRRSISLAKDIIKLRSRSARWIASDALRDLQSRVVR